MLERSVVSHNCGTNNRFHRAHPSELLAMARSTYSREAVGQERDTHASSGTVSEIQLPGFLPGRFLAYAALSNTYDFVVKLRLNSTKGILTSHLTSPTGSSTSRLERDSYSLDRCNIYQER
jgi:hypothetical protein